ncbi:hypothetical protein M513_05824 [Trichuris suis]|uniref:Uncharacterized protein n=1 Tax=Trichuris suis TaxID=68888 RepID=A0A085M7Z7_9BILA|nr:hypothetical protein M513_05824 [Trichuris suis]
MSKCRSKAFTTLPLKTGPGGPKTKTDSEVALMKFTMKMFGPVKKQFSRLRRIHNAIEKCDVSSFGCVSVQLS